MASLSDILIKVGVDQRGVDKGLRSIERNLKSFGKRATALGRNITTGITLPMAAVAGAGIKEYLALEESLTKINTLVGISGKEVNAHAASIKKLSVEVGKTQKELADAMFVVTSAGIRDSAEAYQVLERASKAAALGLGETNDVARGVAGAVQAYAKTGLTAARATDILTATVKYGNLEADSLVGVIGRVNGVAAQLGISFEEVGASIATYTRLGLSAEEATTGLRGIMNTIITASPQQRKALESVGTSIEEVRSKIQEDGLANALKWLVGLIGDNADAMGDIIPNVRALAAALGTAGSQGDAYIEVLDGIYKSQGVVDEGFANASKQKWFKFKQTIVSVQNALIDFAGMIMPIFDGLLQGINKALNAINKLDSGTKKQIVTALGYTTAIGALLLALGKISPAVGLVVKAFRKLLKIRITPFNAIMLGLALVGIYVYKNWEKVRKVLVDNINFVIKLYNENLFVKLAVEGIVAIFKSLVDVIFMAWRSLKNVGQLMGDLFLAVVGGPKKWKEIPGLLMDGFEDQVAEWKKFGKDAADNFSEGIKNALTRQPIELITEEGMQETIDGFIKKFKDGVISVQEFMDGLFTAGGGPSIAGGGNEKRDIAGSLDEDAIKSWVKEGEDALEDFYNGPVTETLWQLQQMMQYGGGNGGKFPLVNILEAMKKLLDENAEKWNALGDKIGRVAEMTAALGDLTSVLFDRQIQGIETKSDKEKEAIEKSGLDEEAKAKKLEKIEQVKSKRIRQVKTQQAVADKAFAIAQAIMNTAQGITAQLAVPAGAGLPLIPFIKAMGAIQIATIAATPLPKFAKGGIVSAATLGMFGEYPGANAGNPEVVAPLKDLKGMLGGMMGSSNIYLSGGFELSGSNLRIALDRANVNHNRTYGYSR